MSISYASIEDVKSRTTMTIDEDVCENLLNDASVMIDTLDSKVDDDIKKLVCIRMVLRALPFEDGMPIGSNQGTVSALGYSQTFSMPSNGSVGELYFSRADKKLLKVSSKIGSKSPLEDLC